MSRWNTFLFAVPIMPRLGAAQFAALEAARLTSTAEPDALTPAVMSGGAEPAGAAKPSLGDCKRVWHVIGPGARYRPGAWWCCDTPEQAEKQRRRMKRAQVSEGTMTYAKWGDLYFWDVRRPTWVEEGSPT